MLCAGYPFRVRVDAKIDGSSMELGLSAWNRRVPLLHLILTRLQRTNQARVSHPRIQQVANVGLTTHPGKELTRSTPRAQSSMKRACSGAEGARIVLECTPAC